MIVDISANYIVLYICFVHVYTGSDFLSTYRCGIRSVAGANLHDLDQSPTNVPIRLMNGTGMVVSMYHHIRIYTKPSIVTSIVTSMHENTIFLATYT